MCHNWGKLKMTGWEEKEFCRLYIELEKQSNVIDYAIMHCMKLESLEFWKECH